MNPFQATAIASQIDLGAGEATDADARVLIGTGFAPGEATELAAQMNAGEGDAARLRGIGIPTPLSEAIADAIDTAND